MTNHKFTDDEVIKALECCSGISLCVGCPYMEIEDCAKRNTIDALALINRQRAEIERLRKYYFTHDYHECHNEAIKEFAERLKKEINVRTTLSKEQDKNILFYIDTLVKEMTEENNESQNT